MIAVPLPRADTGRRRTKYKGSWKKKGKGEKNFLIHWEGAGIEMQPWETEGGPGSIVGCSGIKMTEHREGLAINPAPAIS